MPQIEIQTPVAFITGYVEVTKSLPGSSQDLIYVQVDQNGQNANGVNINAVQASHQDMSYSLAVSPGTWQVSARLGAVKSQSRTVTVAAGEAAEVDFAFGADPD